MTPTRHAVATSAADHVPFAGDQFARMKVINVRADGDDLADKFMTDGERDLDRATCPLVPIVDVDIRAADPGAKHADQDIVDSDCGFGDVAEPEAGFGGILDEGFHDNNSSRG